MVSAEVFFFLLGKFNLLACNERQDQAELKGLLPALKGVIGSSLHGEALVTLKSARKKLSKGELLSNCHIEGLLGCLKTSFDFSDDVAKGWFSDLAPFPDEKKNSEDAALDIWVFIQKLKRQDALLIVLELTLRNLFNLRDNPGAAISYGSASELYFSQQDVMQDFALYMRCQHSLVHKKRLVMLRNKYSLQGNWELLNQKAFHAQVVSIHTGPINETQCFEMNRAAISYGSVSELYFSQQDVMLDLALYMGCQHSLVYEKRLIILRKKRSLQGKWELLNHKGFHAQVVSIHTGPINETQCFETNRAAISYGSASELYFSQQDVMLDLTLYMGCQHRLVYEKRLIMLRKKHGLQGKWELLNHKAFHAQVVSIHTDPINETQCFEMKRAAISYGSASELYFSQQDVMRDLALYVGCQHSFVHKMRLIMLRKKHGLQGKWELLNHKAFHAQVVSVHTGLINETQCFEMKFSETEALVLFFTPKEYFVIPSAKSMEKN